jgi:acid phosphatase
MRRALVAAVAVVTLVAAGAWWYLRPSVTRVIPVPAVAVVSGSITLGHLPRTPRSVVVVVEENKDDEDVLGDPNAPYINALARAGAVFTHSFGIAHPSQPNYFAMFAGRTNRNGDGCPAAGVPAAAANLGAELLAVHRRFTAYAEDLPSPGFAGCTYANYARKHAPWTHFSNLPGSASQPFSALRSYDALPDVAFIIPNLLDDMHSASVRRGDAWLRDHVGPLIAWAKTHGTLVVITWDESDSPLTNRIPTIFVGPMVKPGRYDEQITHYRVLRTIEDLFALPHAGLSAQAAPIVDVWK